MHYQPVLSRLLSCSLLVGLFLLNQCQCNLKSEKQGKQPEKAKNDQNNVKNQPLPLPPVPPKPAHIPPTVGPILEGISEGTLSAMEIIQFTGGGSAAFLVDMLRKLKKDPSQVDINTRDSNNDGATLLHAAVKYGTIKKEEIIRDLVKIGIDINARDDKGQTPLHLAIKRGHGSLTAQSLEELLELGAAKDVPDSSGNTPLHLAAEPGRLVFLQALLQKATSAYINKPNVNGHSPLHVAILNNNLGAVQALLQKSADMKLPAPDGSNALHLAAARGYTDIVQTLLAAGADKTSKNLDGKTALDLAQDAHTIACLGGVAPRVPLVEDSLIQVIEAAGYHFLANKLRHPDQDINSTDPTEDNMTALQQAARLGNNEAVKRLLAHGADVNRQDDQGITALHEAVLESHLEVVQTLLAHGATVDLPDNDGDTPLLCTFIKKSSIEIAKILVAYGADVNYKNRHGERLLHRVVEDNNLSLLQYLLSKKALVNLRGLNTQTPLYIAATKGYEQVVQALLLAGADPNQLGITFIKKYPLSIAINNKRIGVIKMLLEAGAQVTQEDLDQAPEGPIKQLLQTKLP